MYFNIPIKKVKLADSHHFYKTILGFDREHEGVLFNAYYQNVGISFFFEKNAGRAESCYLSFWVDNNLPTVANRIRQKGVRVDLVTDMLERHYTIRLNDPSGNLIQISSRTLQDDNEEVFDTSIVD